MIQMNLFIKQKQTNIPSKQNLQLPKGTMVGRDKLGVWNQHIPTSISKIGQQQGLIIAQGTIFNIL